MITLTFNSDGTLDSAESESLVKHDFVNYQDGQLSVTSYRNPTALGTDIEDLLTAWGSDTGESLTATIITEEERRRVTAAMGEIR